MRARFVFDDALCLSKERVYDGRIIEVEKVKDTWHDRDRLLECSIEGAKLFIWESCLEYLTED